MEGTLKQSFNNNKTEQNHAREWFMNIGVGDGVHCGCSHARSNNGTWGVHHYDAEIGTMSAYQLYLLRFVCVSTQMSFPVRGSRRQVLGRCTIHWYCENHSHSTSASHLRLGIAAAPCCR
mmetsp:Transcript_5776/g.16490  ORF Transcript_5776/g.16490 Transcript_5776/m.16490 type:complete len:120 (+) Transcript_5776:190-549(+)